MNEKPLGEQRRQHILQWLQEENRPLTGGELARRANVSRQVIVQDVALLRASGHPVVATPQGYVYQRETPSAPAMQVIACKHGMVETEWELNTLVDCGVSVLDVIVEHAVYGEIRGALMLETRRDVRVFMQKIAATEAPLLSSLTDGVHLHTVAARQPEAIWEACRLLGQRGILLEGET